MTTTTTTLKRIDEDSYMVLVDGIKVGEVAKGWSRTGGQGWVYNNGQGENLEISTMMTLPTRTRAVATLLSRVANGTTNSINHARRIARQ